MRNDLLFGLCPYVAAGLLLVVPLLRVASPAARRRPLPTLREMGNLYLGSLTWRLGIGLVLLGHVVGFALPHQNTLWRFLTGDPLALQAGAFGLGFLALAGWASLVRERFRPERLRALSTRLGSMADTLFLTLLVLGIGTGMVMTFSYHLGSAWYTVTVTPYLRSLAQLRPDVALVAELPPVVKLHLLSAIAMVAVLPFTALGLALTWPVLALARSTAGMAERRQRRQPRVGAES
ncbi:MAG TPA: respiratory nitrate reductase subunit gamma [Thermoanaerobaculia bacterium]|nr:respiratory nitrate reductase subunit gamma [Thermoanaerobaculia bacterium]